jgi:hypothetical protein
MAPSAIFSRVNVLKQMPLPTRTGRCVWALAVATSTGSGASPVFPPVTTMAAGLALVVAVSTASASVGG